jgi:hypothetical protein
MTTNATTAKPDTTAAALRSGVLPNRTATRWRPAGTATVISPCGSEAVIAAGCPSSVACQPGK